MDSTGLVALEEIYHDLQRHDCHLILSGLRPEVEQLFERSGLLKEIGRDNCFDTTNEALHKIMPDPTIQERNVTRLAQYLSR
jgi:SulP family sulfate permease